MHTLSRLFSKKKTQNQKGFTLIELVLYAGILSILVGVMSALFGSIVEVQMESEATSAVDQDGRYILSKMLYDMKSINENDVIVVPVNPGDSGSTLQVQISAINYTYSIDANSNLVVTNTTTGESNVLNSYNTSVSGLTFQRLGAGGANDTVRVSFTIQSRIQQPSGFETRSFQTTLARQ
jgi:type II secretory pathway pseudopilin PulG